jgi:hypothetical protein
MAAVVVGLIRQRVQNDHLATAYQVVLAGATALTSLVVLFIRDTEEVGPQGREMTV